MKLVPLPTVVVSRRARHPGDNWAMARSWLGGAPRLGRMPWPRGKGGRPLHFFAQLDLAELYAALGPSPLPDTGSLAFFSGTVVYVPESHELSPAEPPFDLPPLSDVGGAPDYHRNLLGERLFPYWPVQFTPVDVPVVDDPDERGEAQHAAISQRFVRRQYNLSAKAAFDGPPIPRWWRIALHFADHLAGRREHAGKPQAEAQRMLEWCQGQLSAAKSAEEIKKAKASIEMYKTKLVALERQKPQFNSFVEDVLAWTNGREPWTLLSEADWQKLLTFRAQQTKLGDFSQYWGDPGIDELMRKAFDALPGEDAPEFANLPPDVRTLIRVKRAPRPKWWHSAWLMADQLREAAEVNAPRVVEKLRSEIDAERTKLRRASPGGALAPIWSMIGGKSEEAKKLEADLAAKQAKLAELAEFANAFQSFVHETGAWARSRDPWTSMTADEWGDLATRFERGKKEFETFARWQLPYSPDSLEDMTIVALLSAEDRGYATLPESVRTLVNREYLLPAGVCHQMFGLGTDVQGAVWEHENDYLLLQLNYDDLMHWSFGDNGVHQFWISPEDLKNRNWSEAVMTVECH